MIRRWLPLIAALILVGVVASSPAAARTVSPVAPLAFTSGDSSEMVTTLPIKRDSASVITKVIYCVDIGPVADGTIIDASAEAEVTNDTGYPGVLVAAMIILADSCAATAGAEITEHNGEDCTPGQHHCLTVKEGVMRVEGDTTRHYVSLIAYAAYSSAAPGAVLKVEQDYGRLNVLVWPGG